MAGKSNTSATFFAQKKLLGKAHTSNLKVDGEEVIGSNIQSSTGLLFGEAIPKSPARTLYALQNATGSSANTAEYIQFSLQALTGTTYNATNSGGGAGSDSGENSQSSGPHAYKFVLPSNYESISSNTRKGNGVFDNDKLVHETLGELQLIPPFYSQAAPNPYIVKIYKDNGGAAGDEIPLLDNIDWNIDYYNGILFLQDYDASKIPAFARAFAYVGKMAQEVISEGGGGGGGSGDSTAEYVLTKATGSLPNAKVIEAGTGINITTGSNSITVSSTIGSINGRSKTTYFVTGTHATNQPLVISGVDFSTVAYDQNKIDINLNGQLLHTGSLTQVQNGDRDYFLNTTGSVIFALDLFEDDIVDAIISVVGGGGGSGDGDSTASYLVLSNTGSLSNERAFVAGTGLLANDGGSNSSYTLRVNDSIVATLTSSATFSNGMSGSLTHLSDGSSYLIAGDNITIVSGSTGAITINSTVTVPTREKATYDVTSLVPSGSVFTTSNSTFSDAGHDSNAIDVFLNGQLLMSGTDSQVGLSQADYFVASDTSLKFGFDINIDDVVNVVLTPTGSSGAGGGGGGGGGSGTTYTAGTGLNLNGTEFSVDNSIFASLTGSVFSGHVGVTGSVHSTAEVSGSIIKAAALSGSLTTLENGDAYLLAGSNITLSTASNGQVTIASSDTNTTYTAGTGLSLVGNQFKVNDSIVPTLTSSAVFSNGISGSLTHLADGSSYLVAGDNITITTASIGSIYISSVDSNTTYTAGDGLSLVGTEFSVASSLAGPGLTETDGVLSVVNGTNGGLFVDTNSVSLNLANLAEAVVNVASDSIAFIDADGFTTRRETIADFVEATAGNGLNTTSGVLSVNDSIVATLTSSAKFSNGLSGSLTQLANGSSYLVAGANVTITSASNGQVTIASSGGSTSPAGSNTQIQFNNGGSFGASSDLTWDGTDFTVNGNANFSEYIYHAGDTDTFIQFADDAIGLTAGGEQLITISEAGQDIVKIGDGGDVDFQVRTLGDDNTLYVQGDTDRIGIGTNAPSSIVHIKESAPTLTLQRENNSNASTINFVGASANTANSIIHDSSTNDLVFKTFNGSAVEEILRIGDHYGTPNRQVIILSGSGMHAGAMRPRETKDIAFFVSGSIGSRDTSIKGTAVFGGDTFVSGTLAVDNQTIFNAGIHEKFAAKTSATGVVTHDCSTGHIFYHTSLSGNFTANFTNLNLSTTYGTNITLVLVQGGTARIPSAVQIGGASQTILWQGGSAPSGTDNGTDVVSFSILNNSGTYTVLGQLVGFS